MKGLISEFMFSNCVAFQWSTVMSPISLALYDRIELYGIHLTLTIGTFWTADVYVARKKYSANPK